MEVNVDGSYWSDAELARAIAEVDRNDLDEKYATRNLDDAALALALSLADLDEQKFRSPMEYVLTDEELKLHPGVKKCPGCNRLVDISAINCGIFRCLALTKLAIGHLNKDQTAHASKAQIDEWIRNGWVDMSRCCGTPFEIHNIGDEPNILMDANGELMYR